MGVTHGYRSKPNKDSVGELKNGRKRGVTCDVWKLEESSAYLWRDSLPWRWQLAAVN
jgi:hypothetical protein